ncbi:unnamed protein product [Ostreobium quekettii]|uniref:Endonuclease/exonuclease/phosphatase domain-containing protein n=1 Tax=Ostreobium quekettii TaxID=121088 RepID=A0A8S1J5Q5_9CHLO|nr:unnamed protein product [Ostreobium quekettii]
MDRASGRDTPEGPQTSRESRKRSFADTGGSDDTPPPREYAQRHLEEDEVASRPPKAPKGPFRSRASPMRPESGAESGAEGDGDGDGDVSGGGRHDADKSSKGKMMGLAARVNARIPKLWPLGAKRLSDNVARQGAGTRSVAHEGAVVPQCRLGEDQGSYCEGERMHGVGNIIQEHGFPHFICLQEVTWQILRILREAAWWPRYVSSEPLQQRYFTLMLCRKDVLDGPLFFNHEEFPSSIMGRGLLSTDVTIQSCPLAVATSHLESPCNGHTYHNERVSQMQRALETLDALPSANVLYAGDMNWQRADEPDGPQLPNGWVDAWMTLRPGEEGLTYDPSKNTMAPAPSRYKARLDRVFCKLRDWRLESIQLVGQEPISNRSSTRKFGKRSKVRRAGKRQELMLAMCIAERSESPVYYLMIL